MSAISVPELGHFALALAVAFAFAQAILPLWGAHRRDARLIAAAPAIALGTFLCLAVAFFSLMYSSVTDDFSVFNIAQNSHSLKPLLYKITGVWGDHEGSILLWCLVLSLCGAAVALFGGSLPAGLRARVLGVMGLSSCGFMLFCLLESNPFLRLWPPPIDGRDMNPLLQDPGLAFHPPILYLGYVGMSVPFAFAVAALIEGRIDAAWGRWVRPWTLAAWCCLTGGIALGSWWSYYELGWGGFWFWDPVENASLLPWLTGTALLHSAIVVEKREALKVWTTLLAIGTFSLSLSGTFLVRSGILNSVHSFAQDPGRGVFILGLLGLVIGGSLLLFAIRAPALAASGIFAPISREGGLVLNNILLCSIAAVVMTGTTFPLFSDLLLGQKFSVGAPFFNATVLPLAVPVFAAMSIGPTLAWKRASLAPALARLWWAALAAAAIAFALSFRTAIVPALALGAAAWLILGAIADVFGRIQLFRIPLRASLSRLAGLPRGAFGTTIAHAGLGVTIAGIAGMTLATSRVVLLKPGQSTDVAGYTWTLQSLSDAPGPNYVARVATVDVSRHGHHVVTLEPARRSFPVQQVTTAEARISTNGFRDLYAVLGDERDGSAVMRLHVNILAPWILVRRADHGGRRPAVAVRQAAARRRPVAPRGTGGAAGGGRMTRRGLLLLAPLGVAAGAGAAFLSMLLRMERGTFDPRGVPSPILGHRVPPFRLPGLTDADLVTGRPVLVNFFASWCIPCIEEAPVLLGLKQSGVPLVGIAYKDKPAATQAFLARRGDPYERVAADAPGLVAIDWGVSGVPETFLVDAGGVVRWHYAMPLTPEIVAQDITPMLRHYA